jgi:hypothetical protein
MILLPNQPQLVMGLKLIRVVLCVGMAIVWAGLLKGDVPMAVVINAGHREREGAMEKILCVDDREVLEKRRRPPN